MEFSDSLENNVQVLEEILAGQTREQRQRSAIAAGKVEKAFLGMKHEHPNDPAVTLGIVYAVMRLSLAVIQDAKSDDSSKGLIQLLN